MVVAPTIIRHIIDSKSPLYNLSKAELQKSSFEVLVVLEGTIEQTGVTFQGRSSYTPQEVHWGHYFTLVLMKLSLLFQKYQNYLSNICAEAALNEPKTTSRPISGCSTQSTP